MGLYHQSPPSPALGNGVGGRELRWRARVWGGQAVVGLENGCCTVGGLGLRIWRIPIEVCGNSLFDTKTRCDFPI
jgi:hypothetical protein